MSAKKIVFSVALLAFLIALVILFIPRIASKQVVLPLPIEKTLAQFTQPERVQLWFNNAWHTDSAKISKQPNGRWVISSPDLRLGILTANSFSAVLEASDENNKEILRYKVVLDT